jgi:hypothetical protein
MDELPIIVRDREGMQVHGCFYVNKYGGEDGADLAYHWIVDGEGWAEAEGERVVETVSGTFAVWLLDGTPIVDY